MANNEEWYKVKVDAFVAECKKTEAAFGALSKENAELIVSVPSKITKTGYRETEWSTEGCSWSKCPRCKVVKKSHEIEVSAGCRMNGDSYGTFLYACKDCGFNDYRSYDEA